MSRRTMRKLVVLAALSVLPGVITSEAAQIDTAAHPSLVIGADGLGLVAYQDTGSLDLKVAHCVDSACSAVTTTTVDSAGDVGTRVGIALRPGGLPAISYVDVTNDDLKLALCSDPLCSAATTVVVDADLQGGGTGATGIAIGSDGLPLIAYRAGPIDGRLKVAHCENATCTTATVTQLDTASDYGDSRVAVAIAGDGRGSIVSLESGIFSQGPVYRHCDNLACTSATSADPAPGPVIDLLPSYSEGYPSLSIAPDGMPVYVGSGGFSAPVGLRIRRCTNTACALPTQQAFIPTATAANAGPTSLAVGADNRPWVVGPGLSFPPFELRLYECTDAGCTSYQSSCFAGPGSTEPSLALDAAGQPIIAFSRAGGVEVVRQTGACPSYLTVTDSNATEEMTALWFTVSLSVAASSPVTVTVNTVDGTARAGEDYMPVSGPVTFAPGQTSVTIPVPIIDDLALELSETLELVLTNPSGATLYDDRALGRILDNEVSTVTISAHDAAVEEDAPPHLMPFTVTLGGTLPATTPVVVFWRTDVGSPDYVGASGYLTFAMGETSKAVPIQVIPDALDEPAEQFELDLLLPEAAVIADGTALGTIIDDDPTPTVSVDSAGVEEGDTGNTQLTFGVRLSAASGQTVRVSSATSDVTATAGSDYVASSGTLTFPEGTTVRTFTVPVIGDNAPEPDERFVVQLSNLVAAAPGVVDAEGHIVDDDWPSLSSVELTHGAVISGDLAADPGPATDQDYYALALAPFASHEIVLDAVSGDAAPGARLELVAADGATVLAASEVVGTGSAATLRYASALPVSVTNHYVRVLGASCGTACDAGDAYRLRVYDTTGFIPRFNNSSSQQTVTILQNPTDRAIDAALHFWNAAGVLLATRAVLLAPHATDVFATANLPSLVGAAGSITVSHDGPYGALAGKAVALEPATGFSFDSPLEVKPR